jgi:hypothetical protein
MQMKATFEYLAYYGYVFNVLSYTLPTWLQDQGHSVVSGIIYDLEVFPGESYAGLMTSRLNPADPDWADWLAQYDFLTHQSGTGDADTFQLGEQGATESAFYRVTLRLRVLVEDE